MVASEIVVTLVAILATLMLTILIIERNALRRTRLKHSHEMLDLAKRLNCDPASFNHLIKTQLETFSVEKKHPYTLSPRFLSQTFFGIALFFGFTGWTYYLLKQEFLWGAMISAVFALLGLVIPFIVWRGFKQRDEDIDRLLRGMEHYQKLLAEHGQEAHFKTPKAPSPAAKVEPPVSVMETTEEIEAVPEDSVLKRHFLTQRQAEQEALTTPYPTDSVLRRHYDTMVKSLLTVEQSDVAKQPVMAMAMSDETGAVVPEDSVLKRHYLTQRQAEQEALTTPYPTDSVLRRHYDTMVKSLLTAEQSDVAKQPASPMEKKSLSDYKMKRRLINKLRSKIEADLFPRPTDSVLQRHYDTLIENEMENAVPDEWRRDNNASSSVTKNLN